MSLIRIMVDEVKSLNVQLRRNTSDLITVKMRVSALRYTVDSRVLGRRNIGGRINSVANSLNSVESKLENLQLFLNKAMDRYLEADDKVRNIANTISKPREKTSSLLNINLFKAFSDIKKSVQKEFKVFEKDANDFIKELDEFAEKTWKNIEMDEKYAELIGNSLFTIGKLEWEKYKKDDPIMAGITVGVLETAKSMTVDLVVGIFGQVKGIIKDPLKKAKEYGELFETINAVILPLTPEDEIIAEKVYNGIWTEVKKGFEKEVIKGDTYTRSKYVATIVSTIATFFIGVGEVKAVESGAKTAEVISETAETVKIIDKIDDGLKVVNDADDVISKAGGITKGVSKAELSQSKINEILSMERGTHPDPSTYLSEEYIANHLANFEGGVTKISANAPSGVVGPPGGTFVMPNSVADALIKQSAGSVTKLEELLSLEPGTLGSNPVRVDIASPEALRMPSGNELGANSQWIPGGYTGGGINEATINPALPGTYTVTPIK